MRWLSNQLLLAITVLGLAVALRLADPPPVARLRLSVFDTYQRLQPRIPTPGKPVRIVDIDDASLDRLGQWPWPRSRLAELVERLAKAGAATISFDIVMAEPDRFSAGELAKQLRDVPALQPLLQKASELPSNDALLAAAVANANVVVGISGEPQPTGRPLPEPKASYATAGDDPKLFVPNFSGGTPSLAELSASAKGIGAVNWLPEHDQIVRRVPLFITVSDKLFPSLAIEQLRLAENASTFLIKSSAGSGITAFGEHTGLDSLRVGQKVLYSDGDGQMWLHFAPLDRTLYIPAYSLLNGQADLVGLAGRHIIIGSSATGLLDLRATPLDASVPGVEIHAQALEQLLAGSGLTRPAWATGAELLTLLLGGGLIAWLLQNSRPVAAAAAGSAAVAIVAAVSWFSFSRSGILLDPVYPALTVGMLYTAQSLFNFVRAETERARVRSAFSHYLAPALVEQLAADPSKLKLGGETRDITMLIADVRGFSRLSEGMTADAVISFVNSVFTPMTDIILDNRGTIDKFMGDAVLAFWNAPLADTAHATQALRAALMMMTRLEELNIQWSQEAAARGQDYLPVRMGIGVNSGPCSVGNVGSPQRVNYSIIGDPVNTASRLEESTKIFCVPILCGEATAKLARNFALLDIGSQTLRGKDRAEDIFAVIGDEDVAIKPEFAALKRRHAALMARLEKSDAAKAAQALAACRDLGWTSLDRLWAVYETRISRMPVSVR